MQSPPAQTFGSDVRPSASTLMRPFSSAIAAPLPFSAAGSKVWPIALNTWSAASVRVSPVPASLPSVMAGVFELDAGDLAAFGDDPLRLQPVADGDALGGGQILLELRGVHVLLAAAVADRHLLGAEQLRLHRGVDRRHAAADDDDAAADRQRWRGPRPGAARR